ncbi:MAG: hypothetical protein M3235_21270 [Actinomycetota bacterium]|nr:hypothetical protein [Actinomycetota bacterium]
MSLELDARLADAGTRFRIFPQPPFLTKNDGTPLFGVPEVVTVSVPPNEMRPGPADDRMYVVDAVNKRRYRGGVTGPPWAGDVRPPVQPDPDGHYTHLEPGSREFRAATMYATVRRVLDIWEDYLGHRLPWHFEFQLRRLELVPLIEWDNAQSGFGFLEFGYGRLPGGGIDHDRPYCENFDVLAHELGHSIAFSEVGVPTRPDDDGIDYGGFQESCGDLCAIVSLLHFESFVKYLLDTTRGNLLTVNGLARVGELSDSRQIRVALNARRMSDVGVAPHERSLPLTGAIFDTMVEVFQQELQRKGLISADLRARSTNLPAGAAGIAAIHADFDRAYTGHEKEFTAALLMARDYLGELLATTWGALSPDFLSYDRVLRTLVRADRTLSGGDNFAIIRDCFGWREIGPAEPSRMLRPRTLTDCGLVAGEPGDDDTDTLHLVGAGR